MLQLLREGVARTNAPLLPEAGTEVMLRAVREARSTRPGVRIFR